jgi:hypothetical protein
MYWMTKEEHLRLTRHHPASTRIAAGTHDSLDETRTEEHIQGVDLAWMTAICGSDRGSDAERPAQQQLQERLT